jgi:hypothetical protein
MSHFSYPFDFHEVVESPTIGSIDLEDPVPYRSETIGSGFYRPGMLRLDSGEKLEIMLYHNPATAEFIYLRTQHMDRKLMEIVRLPVDSVSSEKDILMPGQLCMGSARTRLIGEAIQLIIGSPVFEEALAGLSQQNLAVFPIAREGLKYQVAEALYTNYGFYCDEILLDAHHVFDSSVPVYSRKVELGIFKDKDLVKEQKENIRVAFIADSIASGLVMKEVIARIRERFTRIELVEVIAPLATIRGLCRIARSEEFHNSRIRVHLFETVLNALPPDYYYSAHYNIPELHIDPDLEKKYREWWGKDSTGICIADTACAGYGWSEVFYSPRKQIEMMNGELNSRHNLSISQIVQRNMER